MARTRRSPCRLSELCDELIQLILERMTSTPRRMLARTCHRTSLLFKGWINMQLTFLASPPLCVYKRRICKTCTAADYFPTRRVVREERWIETAICPKCLYDFSTRLVF